MSAGAINICDECGSDYFAASSQMAALCPECAHWLYGYPACAHVFADGRCVDCYWDGAQSAYVMGMKNNPPDIVG